MLKANPELLLLGLAVVVGIVQLLWATIAARGQQGLVYGRGPQDEPSPLTGAAKWARWWVPSSTLGRGCAILSPNGG